MATGESRPARLNRSSMVAIALLTSCAAVLGGLSWPAPTRISGGWQVAEVPGHLWVLLAMATIVCVVVGTVVTARAARLQPRDSLWLATLLLVAAAALVWNALYSAALSAPEPGPIIPVFHWLFTFAPAVLAGWLFVRRGRDDRRTTALGTGVVTVPLLALSWALLDSSDLTFTGVARTLYQTALFGILPLAAAVALAGAVGSRRSAGRPDI